MYHYFPHPLLEEYTISLIVLFVLDTPEIKFLALKKSESYESQKFAVILESTTKSKDNLLTSLKGHYCSKNSGKTEGSNKIKPEPEIVKKHSHESFGLLV